MPKWDDDRLYVTSELKRLDTEIRSDRSKMEETVERLHGRINEVKDIISESGAGMQARLATLCSRTEHIAAELQRMNGFAQARTLSNAREKTVLIAAAITAIVGLIGIAVHIIFGSR